MDYEQSKGKGDHYIASKNILLERETGRVVAVFYNDYDLKNVVQQLEKANKITISGNGLIQLNHQNLDLDQ